MTVRYAITTESDVQRILKIGQQLPKLWRRIQCPVFFTLTHGVVVVIVVVVAAAAAVAVRKPPFPLIIMDHCLSVCLSRA